MPTRRTLLALPALAFSLSGQRTRRLAITGAESQKLARRELQRGLQGLLPGWQTGFGGTGEVLFELRLTQGGSDAESYNIRREGQRVILEGAERGLLYAVFDFLESQGVFFGIDGESYPLQPQAMLHLPPEGKPWIAKPRFSTRGLLPWPDFLNCVTVYNDEDFRAYFEAMVRMRLNTFGMHVYTGAQQWAESYLNFEFGGVGHLAFLDNTGSHRWGYLPQRTSRFGMGAAQFYDAEVFGSDATRMGRDPWETAERTQAMLRRSLDYARRLGLKTGIGFEPYQIPDEIWRALPPEVKPEALPDRKTRGPRFDVESRTARKMLEARLANLLETYPHVDHVWLWEDESANWESRQEGVGLSVTPFLQAHDFLRRNAAGKTLVIGGWGGVARHFADFHKRLPGDIVFSCLSDSLGWDPIHEVFGKLEARERWPIPWLEDDPAMWLPQFHVHRFERDLNLAAQYGCQGMIGIHWRHRIVDPTASYMARFSWNRDWSPARHYYAYAHTQAAGERVSQLAGLLASADKDNALLGTGTREVKNGHVVTREFSGDYNEGFTFWNKYEPDPGVVESQKSVAAALRRLTGAAESAVERERLGYLSGHTEFAVPYTEAWTLAHRLDGLLRAGDKDRIRREGIALWLRLAGEVRRAMLAFQRIVATRNDLGTLAALHNKFVRLALVRLPMSLEERLGDLPAEIDAAYRAAIEPDSTESARLIVPVRPTMLAPGESVRLLAIVPGSGPRQGVTLMTRVAGAPAWTARTAKLLGRRTYEVALGPFPRSEASIAEYYLVSGAGPQKLAAPLSGALAPYRITFF